MPFQILFMDDVWHGDVESGFRWGSYLVTSVGLGFLGGKGLDKVSTLARGAKFSKNNSDYATTFTTCFLQVLD